MATATKAVATQEVFSHSHLDGESEIWTVPAGTEARTLVQEGNRFGVTLTRAAGGTGKDEINLGPYTVSRPKPVGVGNEDVTAVASPAVGVSLHGTWGFEGITGVTATTTQGTPVYVTSAGALTTTESTNTLVGVVNYPASYIKAAGKAPVKIGA